MPTETSTSQRILVFDTETTGPDVESDQIIEIAIQEGLEANATPEVLRCKPSIPISPAAQAVHGISIQDLENCLPFSALAASLRERFQSAHVIIGYNVTFDLSICKWNCNAPDTRPLTSLEN